MNAILKLYPEHTALADYYVKVAEDPKQEALKNPRNVRELLMEGFFVPFLVTAIKELKCDNLTFLLTPELEQMAIDRKFPRST